MGEERLREATDALVASTALVTDRPRGSRHPRMPDILYPLDYGFLEGTTGGDGGGIDVWLGSLPDRRVADAVAAVDAFERDAEVTFLVACSPAEARLPLAIHNLHARTGLRLERPTGDGEPLENATT